MIIEEAKKFLLSLVLYREKFFQCIEYGNKIYKINLDNDYNEIKNIYNDILKNKIFDYNFDLFIFKFKEFIINKEFYSVYLIEYDIIFYLDRFISENVIVFTEE